MVFADPAGFPGLSAWIAMYAYAFQIYMDFSGYTDVALGVGHLLGLKLPENFNLPYLARSPSDFWRRWHITLSTWLRDYLYIPLGGSRFGRWLTARNLFIAMALGGLLPTQGVDLGYRYYFSLLPIDFDLDGDIDIVGQYWSKEDADRKRLQISDVCWEW